MATRTLSREQTIALGRKITPPRAPDLPISLDPKQIQRHAKSDDRDLALDSLTNAIADARASGEDIRNRYSKIMCDVTRTDLANQVAVSDMAAKRMESVAKKLDRARTICTSAIEFLESEIRQPPSPKTTGASVLNTEIRSALAVMKKEERSAAINAAIDNPDQRTIAAVLSAPAFLSGLDETELKAVRRKWQQTRYPEQLQRLERLRSALADFDSASSQLLRWSHKLVDLKSVAEAERLRNVAREAKEAAE